MKQAALVLLCAAAAFSQPRLVRRVITIKQGGARLDWGWRNNLIVFDQKGDDGYYGVYVMEPDGSHERCLTCGQPGVPTKHKGNPEWDPTGRYIVFQAERDSNSAGGRGFGRRGRFRRFGQMQKLSDFFGEPGLGLHNDLWLMNAAGTRYWKLVTTNAKGGGLLHPHFSPRGDRLLWSERIASGGPGDWWGKWALKVADFSLDDGAPRLENTRSYRPGTQQRLYESHGFSSDGQKILFTAQPEAHGSDMGIDIYTLDLRTQALVNLTDSPQDWDEHAHYSPDGRKIVWVSSRGIGLPEKAQDLRADYWIMNADGTGKQRLTYFNQPGHPEYIEGGVAAGDLAWNADGTKIAAYLIEDRRQERGRIVIIELERPQ